MDITRLKKYFSPERVELWTGWLVLIIASLTYLLTLESSASYWDCGEYVSAGTLLESGHPPGNPVWMLTARMFANFAPDTAHIALMINAMSGILSALTVLLLYRTVVLLCRMVWGTEQRLRGVLCGLVGALILCWSDTFWYSAVEAEVYAYAAFITALTLWLALKWKPGDYRIPVALAYLMGLSIGVHLLCLLTIPALVLVIAYKRKPSLKTGWAALIVLISFIPVFFILYGLMPGALAVASEVELLCVNRFGMPFNSGLMIYAALMLTLFAMAIICLRRGYKLPTALLSGVAVFCCGLTSVNGNLKIGLALALVVTIVVLMVYKIPRLSGNTAVQSDAEEDGDEPVDVEPGYRPGTPPERAVKLTSVLLWCSLMMFIGYSSYTLMLVRGLQNTPINQNKIDNIFALQSYIQREQYGKAPLFYGPTPYAVSLEKRLKDGSTIYVRKKGRADYMRNVPGATPAFQRENLTREDSAQNARLMQQRGDKGDYYIHNGYLTEHVTTPELNVPFTRMHSSDPSHIASYMGWTGAEYEDMDLVEATTVIDENGKPVETARMRRPTLWQQLRYFGAYQIGYMYMRYLLWNFVGRQNDVPAQGQFDSGNFITGIGPLDRMMTGDTSQLPPDLADKNPGNNYYYWMPMILGIMGMAVLLGRGRRGRSAFWIVMTLFLLTGIAIVLFLNQTPNEPRERDYSFAGSFYAYAIWCGIGVMLLCDIVQWVIRKVRKLCRREALQPDRLGRMATAITCVLALVVPLQMLSQTYDDHDRSGRRVARDLAANYLMMCEPNAIIFTDGDNYLFPWWYVREVEGVRSDVRIVNLSYLYSSWYVYSLFIPDRDAACPPMLMTPQDIAYDNLDVVRIVPGRGNRDALEVLREVYAQARLQGQGYPKMYADTLLIAPMTPGADSLKIATNEIGYNGNYLYLKQIAMVDIIASNAAQGWKHPIYWSNVSITSHAGAFRYMTHKGPITQLTDRKMPNDSTRLYDYSRLADMAASGKLRWGGISGDNKARYIGPEATHIGASWRRFIIQAAQEQLEQGNTERAVELARDAEQWIPFDVIPFSVYYSGDTPLMDGQELANIYRTAAERTGRTDLLRHAREIENQLNVRLTQIRNYLNTLPEERRGYVSNYLVRMANYMDYQKTPHPDPKR